MIRLLLPVLMLTSSLLFAQTDTSYRLIWYKGKKINDTMLLTPSGRRISFSPRSATVTVNIPDAKNIFLPIIKGIKKNDERREYIARLVTSLPEKHCFIITVPIINRVFDRIEDRTLEWQSNKVPLTVESSRPEILSPALTESWKDLPTWVEVDYEEIKKFLNRISKLEQFDPPPPPDSEFDYCFPCDSSRQRNFRHDSKAFMDSYLGEERVNLDKITDILHYFSNRRAKHLMHDTASAKWMEPELMAGAADILERMELKMRAVWKKYSNDVKKLPFLMDQISSALRYNQLLGRDPDPGFPSFNEISAHAIRESVKFIDKLSRERDYRIILNLDWVMDIFRMAEIMDITNTLPLQNSVMDFVYNVRFKVTSDGDATMANEQTNLSAKMTGENIYVAIADANCRLRWKLMGPDTLKLIHKLEKAQMKVSDQNPAYTGTRKWMTEPAAFKLDFCNEVERDSVLFYNFFPKDGKESWDIPRHQDYPMQTIRSIFIQSFLDKKRMEEMANDPRLRQEMEKKMMARHQEMIAAQQKIKNPSAMTAKDLEQMNNMMRASQDMLSDLPFFYFLIKGHPKNFEKIVFDQTLDGKKLFPDNRMIEHALFRVKIEHVEDGKNQ